MVMSKRISFNEYDAERMYEWYLAVLQCAPDEKHCVACPRIAKRLEKFIGKTTVTELKRLVKKNPYKT